MSHIKPVPQNNSEIPPIVEEAEFNIEIEKYYSGHNDNSKKSQWTSQKIQSVISMLDEYYTRKSKCERPTNKQYYYAKKYDVITIGNQRVLMLKKKDSGQVQIIPTEEYYQKILEAHIATGHGGREKVLHTFKDKYVVPIFAITTFLSLCQTCIFKRSMKKKEKADRSMITDNCNRMGQIDLIDFQTSPDQDYKWLLEYQDVLTKFCLLRPLKSKEAKQVAIEILKIFLEIGCPNVLQSGHGEEFTDSVLKELVNWWPACKTVNGGPGYPGYIECSNQDIKDMIQAWMTDNKSTNWSFGCYFVQFQKNSSYHSTIAQTPFKALFGVEPNPGISSNLSDSILYESESEVDTEELSKDINKKEKDSENEQEEDEAAHKNYITINSSTVKEEENDEKEAIMNQESIKIEIEPHPLMCFICNKESSGANFCSKCNNIIHAKKCGVAVEENEGHGSQLLCNLCANVCKIVRGRTQSQINLKRSPETVLATSSKKLKNTYDSTGSSVLVD